MKGYSYYSCFIAGETEAVSLGGTEEAEDSGRYRPSFFCFYNFFLAGGWGCAGLSCGMQDLHCLAALQNVRS